jgi:uncharacterized protein (DUF58 family)
VRRAVSIVLAGLLLTLVALTFATAPLFVPGLAFMLLGLGAMAWVALAAGGASVERRLDRRRVIENEPLGATLTVSAPRFALTVAELIEPLGPLRIPLEAAERGSSTRVVVRFSRRGRHRVASPSLAIHDPLELARRVISAEGGETELLVLPRTYAVRSMAAAGAGRGSEASGLRTDALAAVDLDGLVPYQPGTSAARIHWPALARGAGLLERQLRAETDTRPLVVLDARGAADAEQLDRAVRAAASLVLEHARSGGCGLLLPGDRRPTTVAADLVAWPSVHARLAVVSGGAGCPAPALGSARSRLGPVFYVTAAPIDRLPPAASAIARAAAVLVLPEAADAPVGPAERPLRPSFEVAGCLGYVTRAWGQKRPRGPAVAPRAAGASR